MAQGKLNTSSNRREVFPSRLLVVPMAWERWSLWGGVWAGRRCRVGDVTGWQWGDWFVVSPGIGLARSRELALRLSQVKFEETWLVGICGGLSPQLLAGDLIQVTNYADSAVGIWEGSGQCRLSSWSELPLPAGRHREGARSSGRIFSGAAYCSERILSRAEKLPLAQTEQAAIVEMESAVWVGWSRARQIRFVHLRVVSDTLAQEPIVWSQLWRVLGRSPSEPGATGSREGEIKWPSARGTWLRNLLPSGVRDSLVAASALRHLGGCLVTNQPV